MHSSPARRKIEAAFNKFGEFLGRRFRSNLVLPKGTRKQLLQCTVGCLVSKDRLQITTQMPLSYSTIIYSI